MSRSSDVQASWKFLDAHVVDSLTRGGANDGIAFIMCLVDMSCRLYHSAFMNRESRCRGIVDEAGCGVDERQSCFTSTTDVAGIPQEINGAFVGRSRGARMRTRHTIANKLIVEVQQEVLGFVNDGLKSIGVLVRGGHCHHYQSRQLLCT